MMNVLYTIKRILKPLAEFILKWKALRELFHKAVYFPAFCSWRRANPCQSFYGSLDVRYDMYRAVAIQEKLDGPICYLEFGVYKGESILWWTQFNTHKDSLFWGFDSFEGLPEDWNSSVKKGKFSTDGKTPSIADPRCRFVVGWFNNTLMPFLNQTDLPHRRVIHLDSDLYSSTLFVLTALATRLKPGDILIFDEFRDLVHEFRAFWDFCGVYPHTFQALAMKNHYNRVVIKVLSGFKPDIRDTARGAVSESTP
jgi:O-methyltransferase